MKVLIKVFYRYSENECLQKGVFPVNYKVYRDSPEEAAADSAKVFVEIIQKMFPEMELLEVLYEDDKDITGLLKERI